MLLLVLPTMSTDIDETDYKIMETLVQREPCMKLVQANTATTKIVFLSV